MRSYALALAAAAAACVLHCASAFTLNAAAAAAAAAAPPAKTDPWAGGPPLWEMQWTAPNKTYVAPAPKGMAVTQLGKRRRYHGGKNVTIAPIAAELRQMGGLWSLDHDAVCNDGRCARRRERCGCLVPLRRALRHARCGPQGAAAVR
jgi:hypothetical protein